MKRDAGEAAGKRDAGFSFVEVLVVLLVLSVLFTVSFAATASLRARGREVQCRNHLRQILAAFRLYLTSHPGSVPAPVVSVPESEKKGKKPKPKAPAPEIDSLNFLGHYTSQGGFEPQGLGCLVADKLLLQEGLLYCPGDVTLLADSPVTGLENLNDSWRLRYPVQSSYFLRPFEGAPQQAGKGPAKTPERAEAWGLKKKQTTAMDGALALPFDRNPGTAALLVEISGNHQRGVHVAYINGSVELATGVPFVARAFSAVGIKAGIGETVYQGSYKYDFGLVPYLWLALDFPEDAGEIISENPPLKGGGGKPGPPDGTGPPDDKGPPDEKGPPGDGGPPGEKDPPADPGPPEGKSKGKK